MTVLSEDDLATVLEHAATVLGTGVAPSLAWEAVAHAHAAEPAAHIAQRVARTPPALLNFDENSPLRTLPQGAALVLCLQVCEATGAPLAGLLRSLASTLRSLTDARRARESAFAGARTTAHILMALPLIAIALGYVIGADPLRMLGGSWLGLLLLAIGALLMTAGWVWMRALLRSAEPPRYEMDPVIIIDVLAHTIGSGLPLDAAFSRIAEALHNTKPGPELRRAGHALHLGAPPVQALEHLDGELSRIRTSVVLSHSTGAQLAPLLEEASAEIRRVRMREIERAAATLNVRLVLPTGLTILPAFVVLGIIPVVTDLLTTYFGWS